MQIEKLVEDQKRRSPFSDREPVFKLRNHVAHAGLILFWPGAMNLFEVAHFGEEIYLLQFSGSGK